MRKIFLDTNILIDVICEDRKNRESSQKILSLHTDDRYRIYASALSLADLAYILRKHLGSEGIRQTISELMHVCNILPLSDSDVAKAAHSDSQDFEDSVQIAIADAKNCDCIITENIRHFKAVSPIPVFSPDEFVAMITG